MVWFFKALLKYATFSGRARRKEYWYFFLFQIIFAILIGVLSAFYLRDYEYLNILINVFQLITLIPSLAVGVRRMHDINRSGWYILIPVYSLILACENGTPGDNDYGPNPQEDVFYGEDDYEKPFNINH